MGTMADNGTDLNSTAMRIVSSWSIHRDSCDSRNGFTEKTTKYVVEKTSGSRYTPRFNFPVVIGSAGISCASCGMDLPATRQNL